MWWRESSGAGPYGTPRPVSREFVALEGPAVNISTCVRVIAFVAIALLHLQPAAFAGSACPNHLQSTWPCPEGLVVVEGETVDGWPTWIGRTCVAAGVDRVMHVLLDDETLCKWLPGCQHYCRLDSATGDTLRVDPPGPLSPVGCALRSYTIFGMSFLGIPVVRIGAMNERTVTAVAPNAFRIEETSIPDAPETVDGVAVVSSSIAVFEVRPRPDSRTAIEYCEWAVPTIKRPRWAVNAGARNDVENTLRAVSAKLDTSRDDGAVAYRCTWPLEPCRADAGPSR